MTKLLERLHDELVRRQYSGTEDRTRAFRVGDRAHLAKLVELTELLATIASFADLIEAHRRSRQKLGQHRSRARTTKQRRE